MTTTSAMLQDLSQVPNQDSVVPEHSHLLGVDGDPNQVMIMPMLSSQVPGTVAYQMVKRSKQRSQQDPIADSVDSGQLDYKMEGTDSADGGVQRKDALVTKI